MNFLSDSEVLQGFPRGILPSQITGCIAGHSVLVTKVTDLNETSIMSFTLAVQASNRTYVSSGQPVLSWIAFSAYVASGSTGKSFDFMLPFEFKSSISVNTIQKRRLLSSAQSINFALLSVWPTKGPVEGNTLVTVRVTVLNQLPSMTLDKFRILSQCPDTENQCLQFNNSSCLAFYPCLQQIPLTNIQSVMGTILVIQYSTIAFTRQGEVLHFLSFQGQIDQSQTATWNFQYVSYQPVAVKLVIPSHGPVDGGTLVRVWVGNLSQAGNQSRVPLVRFGSLSANPPKVDLWATDNSTMITIVTPANPQQGMTELMLSWSATKLSTLFQYDSSAGAWIQNVVPSSGPSDGGFSVLLIISKVRSAVQFTSYDFHVSIDSILCPSTLIVDTGTSSTYSSEKLYLKVDVPAHDEGISLISVRIGGDMSAVTPLVAGFVFESKSFAFGVSEATTSIIPALKTLSAGQSIAVFKLRNIPSDKVADYSVSIGGISCVVMRLDVSGSVAFLFSSTPSSINIGLSVATVSAYDQNGILQSTDAYLENRVNSTQQALVLSSHPSVGNALGGTKILVSLQGFSNVNEVTDVSVLFGMTPGTVDTIACSGLVTEIGLISPSFFCNGTCKVTVRIAGPAFVSAAFIFRYEQVEPFLTKLSTSSVSGSSGNIITVGIKNFPIVESIYEIQINWGGLTWNYASEVIFSDQDQTELSLVTPDLLRKGNQNDFIITVLVTPEIDGSKSVAFDLTIENPGARLLNFRPVNGPCTGGFPVDLVIQHYPVRMARSQNQNYIDTSGPVEAWINLSTVNLYSENITYKQLSGGDVVYNSTTQISFYIPEVTSCFSGTLTVIVGSIYSSNQLFAFNLTLFETSVPTVLSFYPSSASPVSNGAVIHVELGYKQFRGESNMHPLIMAGNVFCDILDWKSSGPVSHIIFQIPGRLVPGILPIRIMFSQIFGQSAEFDFLVLPQTDDLEYDSSSLTGVWTLSNALLSPKQLEIVMVEPQQGPTSGNSAVKIFCTVPSLYMNILETSDIIVTIDGSMAGILNVQYVASQRNIVEIDVSTPAAGASGQANGQLFLFNNPFAVTEFLFSYHDADEQPSIRSVSPAKAYLHSNVSVIVEVAFTEPLMNFSYLDFLTAGGELVAIEAQ